MLVRGTVIDERGTPRRVSSFFDGLDWAVEGGVDSIPFKDSAVSGRSPLEDEAGVTVAETGAFGSNPMPS